MKQIKLKRIFVRIDKLVTMAELGLGAVRPLNKEKRSWINKLKKQSEPFNPILVTPIKDSGYYLLTDGWHRLQAAKAMKEKDIETRSFFYPLHKQPCFKQIMSKQKRKFWRKNSKCLNAEHAYNNGVCLPSFVSLTNDQIKYVCSVIKEFYTDPYLQTK